MTTAARVWVLMYKDFELLKAKNHDYGDSWNESGAVGVLVRIRDKIARAVTLSGGGMEIRVDESIMDTIRDLRVYCYLMEAGRELADEERDRRGRWQSEQDNRMENQP